MGIFGDLTVRENLLLAARGARRIDDIDTQRLDWIFGLFPALKKFWLYPAGKLSGGQKQMLAIARAIVEPRGCCSSTSRARASRRPSSAT
jgi:branched-chain amino acid transport system ATP-binding protein